MVNAAHHSDAGLPDVLARHARVARDGELVVEVAGGLLGAIAFAVWRPAVWVPLACASLCVSAFGAWGISDRELRERSARATPALTRLLRVTRVAAAAAGAVFAMVFLFAILSAALGTWIS
jgi:hypothetical protein